MLNLQNSLDYINKLGTNSSAPNVFLSQYSSSNYILSEQALQISLFGLKPGTIHRATFEGLDVSLKCKQVGKLLGDPLISGDYGILTFILYLTPSLTPTTDVEYAGALASLLAGPKALNITSSDNTSKASIIINLPSYAKDQLQVYYKKNPVPGQVALQNTPVEVNKVISTPVYTTSPEFTMIQSFFADPEAVKKSSDVSLTSIDLYVKIKPDPAKNISGNKKPGVTIRICDVENDEPILSKTYASSYVRKEYDEIFAFSDASSSTTFGFNTPLKLTTGKFYGIVIICDDPSYEFWINKIGDKIVGTNTPSPGSNIVKDGKLYLKNNSNIFKAISDSDLKFKINCAKYQVTNVTRTFVNKDYEFFTLGGKSGTFLGGEYVYKQKPLSSGTLSIARGSTTVLGSGTTFSSFVEGDPIVIFDVNNNKEVAFVKAVTNNTLMSVTSVLPFTNATASYVNTVVGKVYYKDEMTKKLYLVDSTANTDYFQTSNTIIGIDSNASANIASIDSISVDRIKLRGSVKTPPAGKIDINITTAALSGGVYSVNETNTKKIEVNDIRSTNLTGYDAYILSKSNEIFNSSLYSNSALNIVNKSVKINTNLSIAGTGTDLYYSPSIDEGKLDLFSSVNFSSNSYTIINANNIIIDTEVAGNGTALSRHIANKVTFDNRQAEDIKMFMTAYRPIGTELKVYAKVYNSEDPEPFDDKNWTPLVYVTDPNTYSSSEDESNFIEYELGLPASSESANVLPGFFSSSYGSSVLNASGVVPTSYVSNNDIIKLYSTLIPDNYIVGVVQQANTTSITLTNPVTSNNVVGSGYSVDRLKYPNIAFNNPQNDNISRYYNSTLTEFDKFNAMQIKIVFLSNSTYKVPRVDKIQVLGVSA
jgi:hypothetical protein